MLDKTHLFLQLNQPIPTVYKEIFSFKNLTKNKLRIIAGIELYFGNLKELRLIYAAKEMPELQTFIKLLQKQKEIVGSMHELMLKGGMEEVNIGMDKAASMKDEIKQVKNSILSKPTVLSNYELTAQDIADLENRYK